MSRTCIVGIALMAVLAAPVAGWAHGGHTHKVLGTIASVQRNRVEITTTDGTIVVVMLDAKTAITRGKAKVDAALLKAGEQVSVDYLQEKNMSTGEAVKLGTAPVGTAK